MTDETEPRPPPRMAVTAQFLRDSAAKQRAYEERRKLWTAPFHPSQPRAQAAARTRGRGVIADPRQQKLEL